MTLSRSTSNELLYDAISSQGASRRNSRSSTRASSLHSSRVTEAGTEDQQLLEWQIRDAAKKLPFIQRLGYAHGHIMNDLCAGVWFTYLLIFLCKVPQLNDINAGYVMLAGQVADAMMTPVAGIIVDAGGSCTTIGLGPKKMWNFFGTILVAISFFCILSYCIPTQWWGWSGESALTIYYAIAASLFNVGWAMAQVSHMALVPSLTHCRFLRVSLNAFRYGGTILANFTVLLLFFMFHNVIYQGESQADYENVFCMLGYSVIAIGGLACFNFLWLTPEKICPHDQDASSLLDALLEPTDHLEPDSEITPPLFHASLDSSVSGTFGVSSEYAASSDSRLTWFYCPDFYKVGLNYMATRLAVNFAQVYLPIYLLVSLNRPDAISVIPIIVYATSLCVAPFQGYLFKRMGLSVLYTAGTLLIIAACVIVYFVNQEVSNIMINVSISIVAVLLGIGTTVTSIVSVSMEADLVGQDCKSSAFVYGIMSLTDKLSNGLVIIVVQHFLQVVPDKADLVRLVLAFVPAISCSIAVIFTLGFNKKAQQMQLQGAKPTTSSNSLEHRNLV